MKSMTPITIGFGIALTLVGVIGFVLTGVSHPRALIPAALGLILIVAALIGRDPKYHMHAMHAAFLVGLFGFAATVFSFQKIALVIRGTITVKDIAILSRMATAFLCAVFVLRCLQSFIEARRAKKEV